MSHGLVGRLGVLSHGGEGEVGYRLPSLPSTTTPHPIPSYLTPSSLTFCPSKILQSFIITISFKLKETDEDR